MSCRKCHGGYKDGDFWGNDLLKLVLDNSSEAEFLHDGRHDADKENGPPTGAEILHVVIILNREPLHQQVVVAIVQEKERSQERQADPSGGMKDFQASNEWSHITPEANDEDESGNEEGELNDEKKWLQALFVPKFERGEGSNGDDAEVDEVNRPRWASLGPQFGFVVFVGRQRSRQEGVGMLVGLGAAEAEVDPLVERFTAIGTSI